MKPEAYHEAYKKPSFFAAPRGSSFLSTSLRLRPVDLSLRRLGASKKDDGEVVLGRSGRWVFPMGFFVPGFGDGSREVGFDVDLF